MASQPEDEMQRKQILTWSLGGLVILALGIQVVPYGRNHTNPPVTAEPQWNDPATKELAVRACYDCHSNETVWPWYSNVAPFSWIVQHDVQEARSELNFSEFDKPQKEVKKAAKEVEEGGMPEVQYTMLHPNARLTAAEKAQLAAGLKATLADQGTAPATTGEPSEGGGQDDDGD
jgi:Haem-binding domain